MLGARFFISLQIIIVFYVFGVFVFVKFHQAEVWELSNLIKLLQKLRKVFNNNPCFEVDNMEHCGEIPPIPPSASAVVWRQVAVTVQCSAAATLALACTDTREYLQSPNISRSFCYSV